MESKETSLHCRCDPKGQELCLVKTSLSDRLCSYICQRLVEYREDQNGLKPSRAPS